MVDGQGTAGKPMQHTKEIAPADQAEEAQTTVDSKLESVISVVNTSELSKQYQCLTRINMFFFGCYHVCMRFRTIWKAI